MPLAIGLFTAIYGVVFAAAQTDMKRLLAFSSIENIGIIFTAVGLAIVFLGVGMTTLAALALIAALYHALNHAFMKSLLFLGTGSVLHATGERNLGRLGGLIHRMPWVAWLTLVGVLAIAGLPPLNGFVSEWLLLQAFLFGARGAAAVRQHAAAARRRRCRPGRGAGRIRHGQILWHRIPRPAARSGARRGTRCGLARTPGPCVAGVRLHRARTAAIADHRLVSAGPRTTRLRESDAGGVELVALRSPGGPAGGVRAIGVPADHNGNDRSHAAARERLLSPASAARRCLGLRIRAPRCAHAGHRRRVRPADPSHFPAVLRHATGAADSVRPCAAVPGRRRRSHLARRYLRLARGVQWIAEAVAWLQQGRIATYLLYSFVTLLVLLAFVL